MAISWKCGGGEGSSRMLHHRRIFMPAALSRCRLCRMHTSFGRVRSWQHGSMSLLARGRAACSAIEQEQLGHDRVVIAGIDRWLRVADNRA